jgi:type VI secretion system protein ImpH
MPAADPTPPRNSSPAPDFGAEPWKYDFFRAVRLLECAHRQRPRMGESLHPKDDPVRFGQRPSLAFASSTLASYEPPNGEREAARLLINFTGLLGPNGPMPLHLTEHARDRQRNAHDVTLVRFLDVFHHRMISLFYRAWADGEKAVDFDRPENSRFADYLGSFFGLGMDSLRNRDEAPDWTKIYFSGRLSPHIRNPEGLEAILIEDFGIPTKVQTFQGQWMRLPTESLCKLGASPDSGTLGRTAIVGEKFWAGQLKFRLRLGAMRWKDYQRLLPTGTAWRRLQAWVRNYIGREFFWEAQLVLMASEAPSIALGRTGQLGWSTWLKSKPFQRDADNLILAGDPG